MSGWFLLGAGVLTVVFVKTGVGPLKGAVLGGGLEYITLVGGKAGAVAAALAVVPIAGIDTTVNGGMGVVNGTVVAVELTILPVVQLGAVKGNDIPLIFKLKLAVLCSSQLISPPFPNMVFSSTKLFIMAKSSK